MPAIESPYLLFLGDAEDPLTAKVARGIVDWRPEQCVGQMKLPGCAVDLGLRDMDLAQGREAGARTLVVGVANRGGVISDSWTRALVEALEAGYDLASGLHDKLADRAEIARAAAENGRRLFDVRHSDESFEVASGAPRSGRRLLTVGSDCSVGKMYTALAIEREMRSRGWKVDFRATGQTGILITGSGVSVDAVVSDFISGAVEAISPANDADHWDIVEGQGSLFHPSFAGVSLGLLHGAQPDALVLCHEPTRTHMRGLPQYPLPDLEACMDLNLRTARLTSPEVRFAGISVNTSQMPESEAADYLASLTDRFDLPAVDAYKDGVAPIVDRLDS